MTPENIFGNNWRLFDGESVTGEGGTIKGPVMVKVERNPEGNKLLIQAEKQKVEIEGMDFKAIVQKT